ncbi:hypothetical protein HUN08_01995 [Gordonia sp. X0973]|uniref:hypothetical protein n=1 Tax=Gordonia sp. X0973 TaxID=2742602 RepID=UPI000F52CBEF|nr:hypothetical protein [Gordonia sp. X0973]QKT06099.1 hypothetical protein HUN08_01995 [Gordonia sp. X0973]
MKSDASPARLSFTGLGVRTGRSTPEAIADTAGRRSTTPQLRRALADRRELLVSARMRAQSPVATMRAFGASTPGKLFLITIALFLGCLATGWYASVTLNGRTHTLQQLISRAEPIAESSQVLFSSLSIADASANSAFISGGLEPVELRKRYSDAIASASAALITAANSPDEEGGPLSASDDPVHNDLVALTVNLPVYTGLVETARANNRLGNPVGSAYLNEASGLMQETLLPAAQRIYEQRTSAIAQPQQVLTRPPYLVYGTLFAMIAALVAAARFLERRTRRRLNLGILVSLVAMSAGTVWLLIAGLTSVASTNTARVEGADPLHALTSARISLQQARSAQTLSLVRRDQTALNDNFTDATRGVAEVLNKLADDYESGRNKALPIGDINSARQTLVEWQTTDRDIGKRLAAGDYLGARDLTVGTGPTSAATYYADVDSAIVRSITKARSAFRDNIYTAGRLLAFSSSGIAVLAVIAAVAVPVGMYDRIREYR